MMRMMLSKRHRACWSFDEMVVAQGLGDEDSQAPRDEEGDRGAGATVGRDHAPHLGRRYEFRWTRERSQRHESRAGSNCDRRKLELHRAVE